MERSKKYTVRDVAEDFDAAIVSSVRTYGNLGPFRPIDRAEFKGIRIFDLLLRHPQIVCGSSVKPGDPENSLYGNWGIILADGDIKQAYPYDALSYTKGSNAYSPYSWRIDNMPVKDQVSEAMNHRMGHNEIDVAIGSNAIAGIYLGSNHQAVDGVDFPSQPVINMVSQIGIPFYSLKNGRFYSTVGAPYEHEVSITDLISNPLAVSDEQASTMKQILTNTLFLPSRNAISAGWQFGNAYKQNPSHTARNIIEQSSNDDLISHRYFGTMAIYAAEITSLSSNTAFSEQEYRDFVSRVTTNGMLRAARPDIDFYLRTGHVPDYYGEI